MNNSNDLDRIERKAYQSMWEDGLLDILVGVGLIGIGIAWLTDYAALGAILPALLVPVWSACRKQISVPRSGYVEFSARRRRLERRQLLALAVLGLLTFQLGVMAYLFVRGNPATLDGFIRQAIPALPAILLGVGAALIGLFFGIRRFLGYSFLLLVTGFIGALLQLRPGWHFLPPGTVVLIVGIVLLLTFLRKYSIVEGQSVS